MRAAGPRWRLTDRAACCSSMPIPTTRRSAPAALIARLVAEGGRVDLVTCTDGAEGEIHDPTLDHEEAKPAACARSAPPSCACPVALRGGGRAPGAAPARLPRLRDDGHRVERAARRLLERGPGRGHRPAGRDRARHAPAVMVSYDENGNYGHPDHINAYRIAAPERVPPRSRSGPPQAVGKLLRDRLHPRRDGSR